MLKGKLLLILPVMFLLFLFGVLAAGIGPGVVKLNFFPNEQITIPYVISGYGEFYIDDIACDFLTVNDDVGLNAHGEMAFSVTLKFPEKLEPGIFDCGFMVKQGPFDEDQPSPIGGVGAISEVGAVIKINVPFEGRYAKIKLQVDNSNKGEPVYFHITAQNLGDIDLKGIISRIDIFDMDDNKLETLYTSPIDVLKFDSKDMWKKMETIGYESARYRAVATLNYGGLEPATDEAEFLIGRLFVDFLKMSDNATVGKINPIDIEVGSWWGNTIENVYAEVSLINESGFDGGTFQTVSTELQPWAKASLRGYWDATDLSLGKYNAQIVVKYAGGETDASSIIELLEESQEVKKFWGSFKPVLTSPVFLLIILILLIIANLVYLVFRTKQKSKKGKIK